MCVGNDYKEKEYFQILATLSPLNKSYVFYVPSNWGIGITH